MNKLYYTEPPEEQFNEVKEKAIKIWSKMGSEPSYSKEKIDKIKKMKNIEDNFMYIVAMFGIFNQRILADSLTKETRKAVTERIIDGRGSLYATGFY